MSAVEAPGAPEYLREALLTLEPDLAQVRRHFESEFAMAADDARTLIYSLVCETNAALFPPVTKLELIHTEGCNLGCSYCFEKDMLGYRRMSPEVATAAVNLLFDYAGDARKVTITHFGGEPTLNFRAIRSVTEHAERRASELGKELEFDMTSNGVIITQEMAEYFAEHRIMVLLSVDGLAATHDRYRRDKRGRPTFDRVMTGMRTLKATQNWIGVKMTVMPENVPVLYDDVLGLYELGVNQFIIGYATGISWSPEAMASYAQELGRVYGWYKAHPKDDLRIAEFDDLDEGAYFGCQAGRNSITVAVNGEISPCAKILALDNRRLLAKLGDVQYGITHLRNRQELVGCASLIGAAERAGISDEFRGGCFASNFSDTRNLFEPSLQDHQFSLLIRGSCAGCSASKPG